MSLVFAAVLPHNPLLVPTVAQHHHRLSQRTIEEIRHLAAECYAAQPDVIIILTPHGLTIPQAVVVVQGEQLHGQLKEFGDVTTSIQVRGAVRAAHYLKELSDRAEVPLVLQTTPELDYGLTVPLTYLTEATKQAAVLPVHVAGLSFSALVALGQVLHDVTSTSRQRFAIIASADLSRQPAPASAPRRPTEEERAVAEALSANSLDQLSTSYQPLSTTCGLAPIIGLIAAVDSTKAHGVIRSFEAPMGVGFCTAGFVFGS